MLFQFLLGIDLLLRTFESWRQDALHSIAAQATRFDALFSLSGIGLILEVVLRPSNNSVEDAPFFVIIVAWANDSTLPELILGLKLRLKPVEVGLGSCDREVVALHAGHQ